MKNVLVLAAIAALASTAFAQTTYIDDDFEVYPSTAAMQTVWGSAGLGTLDPNNAFSGTKSMAHPGGADNIINLAADLIPSDAQPVVLRGEIFDDALSNNKRFTIGLRSLSTFPLFEMGMYNSILGVQYYARVSSFPGQSPSWVPLNGDIGPTAGWHEFEATFSGSSIVITLDLNSDSVIDSTTTFPLTGEYTSGLGSLRLGGPSSLSSAGGGGNFDDIYLAQLPEPTTLLLLLSGLALIRRR